MKNNLLNVSNAMPKNVKENKSNKTKQNKGKGQKVYISAYVQSVFKQKTVWDITWLTAIHCHLCKSHLQKEEQ